MEGLISMPSTLDQQDRAWMVATRLLELDERLFDSHLVQTSNEHTDDDCAPGTEPPMIYRDQRAEIEQTRDRLISQGFASSDDIETAVKVQRRQRHARRVGLTG